MLTTAPRIALSARDSLSAPISLVGLAAGGAVGGYCLYAWSEWTTNPDLSHGVFAPAVFVLLLWEGTRSGSQRWLTGGVVPRLAAALAAVASVLMFTLGGLLAASLGWSHNSVGFAMSASLAGLLFAAVVACAHESVRIVPFNWPVLTAVGLWIFAAPLPTGTYSRITLSLQAGVTEAVLSALHVLGIPARQTGNIIELASTTVGIEDACSGIRSLISCLYAGLFFAGWLVRTAGRRAVLIVLAPLLAIVMNFARSLALTLLANRGVDIAGFWHDATGYAILALTALVLGALAMLLSPAGAPPAQPTGGAQGRLRTLAFAPFLGGTIAIALLLGLFVFHQPGGGSPEPRGSNFAEVATLLPDQADGWQVGAPSDLNRFAAILQTPHLAERTYTRLGDGRKPVQVNVYVAYWSAGAASVSMVASHTPDACWPGSGWVAQSNPEPRMALTLPDGARIPTGEHRLFSFGSMPQHVWFWHIYDGRPTDFIDPYSIPALVRLALRYGFRREGSQYFVRVSSNVPWDEIRNEPLIAKIFTNLAPIGLTP